MSWMIREISEQPTALARILKQGAMQLKHLRAGLTADPRLIVLVARGSSDNAAQFGRYLIELTTGIPVSLAAPSIHTVYGAKVRYKDALVVAISQSGESTDINVVLENARAQGAVTVGITNEPKSALAQLAEHTF